MAHLIVEYSEGIERQVDMPVVCRLLHQAMISAEIFPVAGIRVRAYRADVAIIADDDPANGFVTMTLVVGHGRQKSELVAAGKTVFTAAQEGLAVCLEGQYFALSLEIREIDPALSWKVNTIRHRLKTQETKKD